MTHRHLPYAPKRSIPSEKTFTPVNIDFKHILVYNCGKCFTIYLLSVLVTKWTCEGVASSQERDEDFSLQYNLPIIIHLP